MTGSSQRASNRDHPVSRKRKRKAENPTRFQASGSAQPNSWVCKNSACGAVLSSFFDSFCKKCSCYICHAYDEDRDPSLWLECSSEHDNRNSCGLSCHVECALQRKKVGVVNLGSVMQLDGSSCCSCCGKVSGIIRYWKDQMTLAKDARRIDTLCYRLFLSYRLLKGTSKFVEMLEIVKVAMARLETEVGPIDGVPAMTGRCLVNRLSIGPEVQKHCALAIEKAEEWLVSTALSDNARPIYRDGSLPAACRFMFEKVNSTSVMIVLLDLANEANEEIKGYKLWYCKSRSENYDDEPNAIFPRSERKFAIFGLQPCTEYSFRVVSYTDEGKLGHSEARCFTNSRELFRKEPIARDNLRTEPDFDPRFTKEGFHVRNLGKGVIISDGLPGIEHERTILRNIHLVSSSVPDLNKAPSHPPFQLFRDEEAEKNGRGDSNTLHANGSNGSGPFDENFEYNVKIIRWLEREGHIEKEFRQNLLTWFSLRSTEQGRRIVNSYIQSMIDDPSSLASQLVDSLSDIVSNKRQRN